MIPKSGHRFSDQIMPKTKGMTRKNVKRFSGKVVSAKKA
jgi:hypothetical protein